MPRSILPAATDTLGGRSGSGRHGYGSGSMHVQHGSGLEAAVVSWKELGGPARTIGAAINRAVDTVGDRDDFTKAAAELASLPAGAILGALVRAMLEDQHPDGLDSDDIQAVLARCYQDAAGWLPLDQINVNVLLAVLASALGIHEPGVTYDEITAPDRAETEDWTWDPPAIVLKAPSPAEYAWHAPILIADLRTAGRARLGAYLDAAFTEIARAETMEMP
jgi:hypothetical protein